MASVVVTMDAREAALFRAMDKLIKKQQQVNEKLKDGGRASETAARKSKDGWDRSAMSLSNLKAATVSYVAGLGAAGLAVDGIRRSWEQLRKEQKASLEALENTAGTDRRLGQVSGSLAEFQQLRQQADALSARHGVDRNVTREVLFAGISEGFKEVVPQIIAANSVVDPIAAAGVAGQMPALFKGTIGAMESVNLTLKAAQSSRLDFEKLAVAVPQAAEGGGIAKATAQETLAVLSVLASELKSGETAADRIKMFATRVGISDDMSGIGIVSAVEKIQAMDEDSRRNFLGDSQELNVAYIKMSDNLARIKSLIAELNREGDLFSRGDGIIARSVRRNAFDPELVALKRVNQERQRLQIAESEPEGALAEAAVIRKDRLLLQRGSMFSRTLESWFGIGEKVAGVGTAIGLSDRTSSELGFGASQAASTVLSGGIDGIWTAISNGFGGLEKSSANLNQAADKINRSNVGAARAQAAGAGN